MSNADDRSRDKGAILRPGDASGRSMEEILASIRRLMAEAPDSAPSVVRLEPAAPLELRHPIGDAENKPAPGVFDGADLAGRCDPEVDLDALADAMIATTRRFSRHDETEPQTAAPQSGADTYSENGWVELDDLLTVAEETFGAEARVDAPDEPVRPIQFVDSELGPSETSTAARLPTPPGEETPAPAEPAASDPLPVDAAPAEAPASDPPRAEAASTGRPRFVIRSVGDTDDVLEEAARAMRARADAEASAAAEPEARPDAEVETAPAEASIEAVEHRPDAPPYEVESDAEAENDESADETAEPDIAASLIDSGETPETETPETEALETEPLPEATTPEVEAEASEAATHWPGDVLDDAAWAIAGSLPTDVEPAPESAAEEASDDGDADLGDPDLIDDAAPTADADSETVAAVVESDAPEEPASVSAAAPPVDAADAEATDDDLAPIDPTKALDREHDPRNRPSDVEANRLMALRTQLEKMAKERLSSGPAERRPANKAVEARVGVYDPSKRAPMFPLPVKPLPDEEPDIPDTPTEEAAALDAPESERLRRAREILESGETPRDLDVTPGPGPGGPERVALRGMVESVLRESLESVLEDMLARRARAARDSDAEN